MTREEVRNKDFKLFQEEFEKWQERFGLTGYKVYFKYEPLDDSFASISVNQEGMIATVTLNSLDRKNPLKEIKRSAKHEALHLLLARLERRAKSRFANEDEIYELVEELTNKLECLIE